MDSFTRDGLPPREQWPDLLLLDYPARLNVAEELLKNEGTAIANGWSYAELAERADAVAGALNIEPGERVLLHSPNTPEAIACWLGILLAGGVVVATMPLLRRGEIDKVVAKANVTKALVARDLTGEVDVLDMLVIEDLPTRGWFDACDTAADDVAIIAFTSGTTGVPKGCVHFHRDLLASCDTFAREILRPQPTDVFSGSPPIAFTFGLGASLLFPLRFGAATAPTSPPQLLETLHAKRVTTLFTAPTAYRALLREELPDSLHTCVSAGEPLPAGVSDAWLEKTGIRIVDGIGSTEMLHIFIASRADEAKAGSCGRPVPGYEARIVGPDMETLGAGEVGRLAVRGPTGCRYLDDERQTTYVREGWNLTGDAFSVDTDGYFWFQARTDDMIISAGYNISGFEVEAALLEHPLVAECAVVAVDDAERGHVVKAWVVATEPVEAKALQDFVKARIAPYKYPRRVEFVDALPRTPTGKVQRNVLRDRG
ncbi:AMP-binding protein [Solirubrobacter phytolaccae]|uniref:AMP-binding protein n=1 Tax=Solirubrobacter phytolaccae TaxID=1404360 RepID=A0A9X3SCB6_9ACTN|nr:AMP-binding protein [Solirubrobacter phytolaccae]MDA0182330.1 AMP-binding protein [Solirubrobacter phytolaccae]